MSHVMRVTALAGSTMLFAAGPATSQIPDDLYEYPEISIGGSTASCTEIWRDGDGLFAYRYSVENALASDAGIKSVFIDISAPRATSPVILFTRGRFRGDATRNPKALSSHVPVALDIPEPWSGFVHADGWVKWRSPVEFIRATEPIEPGAARDDLVLRSPYLPGIRGYRLVPDYPHLCCRHEPGDPRNDAIAVKDAEDFQVTGAVVAPTYAPDDVDLEVLGALLARACGELAWISNRGVCRSLRTKLDQAERSIERDRLESARGQLGSFLREIEAQHGPEPGKHVNDDAYWLLKTNVKYLLEAL